MGGSKNVKKRTFWVRGVRGGQFINYLKFSHFLQKRARFRPPKSTPKIDLLKNSFHTKTPVLLLQWGSENVTFWGVGGRTAFCKKCRHYYISNFHFLTFLGPLILTIFHPGYPHDDFYFSRPYLSDTKMEIYNVKIWGLNMMKI
jgi:hypothetical protein